MASPLTLPAQPRLGGRALLTAQDIRVALRMRHSFKGYTAPQVLEACEQAAARLKQMQRLPPGDAEELRAKFTHARQMDKGGGR